MYWGEYVPVAQKRANGKKKLLKILKNKKPQPVEIVGQKITKQFWGQKWCAHLESFAEYENRLPRGRTYARNGSVCHLEINKGVCTSYVSGSDLYKVAIEIKPLSNDLWSTIKKKCGGQLSSILELLQGKISKSVMEIVSNQATGLFPQKKEISYTCNCPDSASLCKHIAAVFYGIGNRLDHEPDLLFVLRGVDPSELVTTSIQLEAETSVDQLASGNLSSIFGIEMDGDEVITAPQKATKAKKIVSTEILKTKKKKTSTSTALKVLDFDNLIGSEISYLRQRGKFAHEEFANKLGVKLATVYRWEESTVRLKFQPRTKLSLQMLYSEMS